jgi:tRNA-specific 2-thiouridylase
MPETSAVIGMSGGLDSSVAALMLKEQGYRVVGVTLRLLSSSASNEGPKSCCSDAAIMRAKKICRRFGIEHLTIDCRTRFSETVIREFVDEYRAGRTPNPCITCNEKIKFPQLAAAADRKGCSRIATGHYAGLVKDGRGRILLASSPDVQKDQSYFLYRVPVSLLERTLFPLQGMSKEDVRSKASRYGLREEGTRESQDVCFLGGTGLSDFLSGRLRDSGGRVIDEGGRTLGRHGGTHNFTLGQRRGLGISSEKPLYVTGVDAERSIITLGSEEELYSPTAVCHRLRLRFRKPTGPLRAKIRYRHAAAEVERVESGGGSMKVRFRKPQRAITPGQSLVLYREGIIVGGGVISSSERR